MIKEDYCSFEIAKLLKEKGFDEFCLTSYNAFLPNHKVEESKVSEWGKANQIYRPTQQMAMKWLREVRGLSVEIFSIKGTSNVCPVFWKGNVVKLLTQDRVFNGELVGSYEESVEAALKYTLENLI